MLVCNMMINLEANKQSKAIVFNPYLTNEYSHYYLLGQSTFIFRGIRSDFEFSFHFSMKFLCANRKAPDKTPCSAASHLGL